jgi:hypothetical protein
MDHQECQKGEEQDQADQLHPEIALPFPVPRDGLENDLEQDSGSFQLVNSEAFPQRTNRVTRGWNSHLRSKVDFGGKLMKKLFLQIRNNLQIWLKCS